MKTLRTSLPILILLSASVAAQSPAPPPQRPLGTTGVAPVSPPPGPATTTTTTAAPAPPAVRPATNLGADYKLVPGDKLRVEIYKDAQLSQNVQVRPDGKITLPLANDIPAAGRTPAELRDAIGASLKPYIANPTVTVIVVETVPPVIHVMGEVNRVGPQPLVGKLDVLQALSAAGGFRDFANTKNIKIRRGSQVLRFNYKDAVDGRGTPIYLQPGDMIIVP